MDHIDVSKTKQVDEGCRSKGPGCHMHVSALVFNRLMVSFRIRNIDIKGAGAFLAFCLGPWCNGGSRSTQLQAMRDLDRTKSGALLEHCADRGLFSEH